MIENLNNQEQDDTLSKEVDALLDGIKSEDFSLQKNETNDTTKGVETVPAEDGKVRDTETIQNELVDKFPELAKLAQKNTLVLYDNIKYEKGRGKDPSKLTFTIAAYKEPAEWRMRWLVKQGEKENKAIDASQLKDLSADQKEKASQNNGELHFKDLTDKQQRNHIVLDDSPREYKYISIPVTGEGEAAVTGEKGEESTTPVDSSWTQSILAHTSYGPEEKKPQDPQEIENPENKTVAASLSRQKPFQATTDLEEINVSSTKIPEKLRIGEENEREELKDELINMLPEFEKTNGRVEQLLGEEIHFGKRGERGEESPHLEFTIKEHKTPGFLKMRSITKARTENRTTVDIARIENPTSMQLQKANQKYADKGEGKVYFKDLEPEQQEKIITLSTIPEKTYISVPINGGNILTKSGSNKEAKVSTTIDKTQAQKILNLTPYKSLVG